MVKRQVFNILIFFLLLFCVLINLNVWKRKSKLNSIKNDYSFVIGKKVVYGKIIEQLEKVSENYILSIINPVCESCYVKINQWDSIVSKNKLLKNNKVVFLVVEDEFERLDEIISDKKDLIFIFDYENEFMKNNKYFTQSQTYLINKQHEVILCGDPLHDKITMSLFMDEID